MQRAEGWNKWKRKGKLNTGKIISKTGGNGKIIEDGEECWKNIK